MQKQDIFCHNIIKYSNKDDRKITENLVIEDDKLYHIANSVCYELYSLLTVGCTNKYHDIFIKSQQQRKHGRPSFVCNAYICQ